MDKLDKLKKLFMEKYSKVTCRNFTFDTHNSGNELFLSPGCVLSYDEMLEKKCPGNTNCPFTPLNFDV